VTTGSVHDAKVIDLLIREDDRAVYGDRRYANDLKQQLAEAAGSSVGREDESQTRASAVADATPKQSPVRDNPCKGRACLPGDEMPFRLSQGSLSRHLQERRTSLRAACARQPIPRPQDTCVRATKTSGMPLAANQMTS
jgi:IS5 family transposase